ncbi:hypothetical protein FOYG_17213 [Fusarium oxysporum NRRL 32931]|uniref:Uncharacterized protein n=1 Tax=Fusarium oxysporum NRRL 32931 TaxID=660029 RepID=W9HF70_FUSOX|nr:hypothetical protein FOYG_17213 [Fusarium oxysporum NRRL 32931]
MKLSAGVLLVTLAFGQTSPVSASEQEAGFTQLQSRGTAYDVLSSYAEDLILKPVLSELGIKYFLPQSTQVVDLSQKALTAIANIMDEAIQESWFSRDKTKVSILVQNSRDYTRNNGTEQQISSSLAIARDYHEEANLIFNYLSLYGLQAAPSAQTILGLYILFKKEEVALTRDLDVMAHTNNHIIKFEGFKQRLDEMTVQLKGYGSQFKNLPNQLFRTRTKESGEYPCPGCICKKKSHIAYFESRPNPSAPWKTVHKLEQKWPYCGKRPSSKINRHKEIIQKEADDAKEKYFTEKRDAFLTSGYDTLVSSVEDIRTWDVDRLMNSLFVQDHLGEENGS